MEILDGDDVHHEEFLGDIDEVIENMKKIRLEQFSFEQVAHKPTRQTKAASTMEDASVNAKRSAGGVLSFTQLGSRSQNSSEFQQILRH